MVGWRDEERKDRRATFSWVVFAVICVVGAGRSAIYVQSPQINGLEHLALFAQPRGHEDDIVAAVSSATNVDAASPQIEQPTIRSASLESSSSQEAPAVVTRQASSIPLLQSGSSGLDYDPTASIARSFGWWPPHVVSPTPAIDVTPTASIAPAIKKTTNAATPATQHKAKRKRGSRHSR